MLVGETKTGHTKLCIGLQGFVFLSLSRSLPFLQDILNQCETEWCNHHFFSVTIVLPSEGLRMSVFHFVYQIVYQFSDCWLDGCTTYCKQINFLFVCDLTCGSPLQIRI